MKKIIVKKQHLQAQKIEVNPNTFQPEMIIVIDQQYYDTISETYNIHNIHVDYSQFENWVKENVDGLKYGGSEYVEIQIRIGNFIELDENDYNYRILSKWIDNMYDFDKGYAIPVVINVSEKEEKSKYTVKDATQELCKRYIEVLTPLKDIEKDSFEYTSNNHLIGMCQNILNDNSLPEDKISRWIGFVQGVMTMKGYTTVNTERDFSRPLFHKVYNDNDIAIPETKELNEETDNIDNKVMIKLCYNAFDKNNNISEYKSPKFYATDKNLIFLNFVTSILEGYGINSFYSKNRSIIYINDNWDIFEKIMKDFSDVMDIKEDVMDIFDSEILEMLIEYFRCNDYVPQEFYNYDFVSEINPDGFSNGLGVFAFERV